MGTSAPNTVITESALQRLHVADQNSLDGWLIQSNNAITSAQLTSARSLAASNEPEHRVEERRADVGRDRQLGDRLRHRARPWVSSP